MYFPLPEQQQPRWDKSSPSQQQLLPSATGLQLRPGKAARQALCKPSENLIKPQGVASKWDCHEEGKHHIFSSHQWMAGHAQVLVCRRRKLLTSGILSPHPSVVHKLVFVETCLIGRNSLCLAIQMKLYINKRGLTSCLSLFSLLTSSALQQQQGLALRTWRTNCLR